MLVKLGDYLHELILLISPFVINVLELFGILIIIFGSIKAIVRLFKVKFDFSDYHFKIDLGEAFAAGLQFKVGAEIIKTVIVRDLNELLIVGAVVLLRIILTFLIHWEITRASEESVHDHITQKK